MHIPQVKLTKDKVLVISGKHTANTEATHPSNSHSGSITRTFTRRYQLPNDTETEGISARLQDGLLTLTVPKAEVTDPQDQEISIQEASSSFVGATGTAATAVDAPTNEKVPEASSHDQEEMGTASVKEDAAEAPSASDSVEAAREEQRSA